MWFLLNLEKLYRTTMQKKSLYLLMFLFLVIGNVLQAQVTFSGEIRPRAELRDGYFGLTTANQTPAFFISQRTRLGVQFKTSNLDFKITGQDARIWGGDNGFSLYEAWAKYKFSDAISVKIGRQELQYDEGRLISARNRRQDGFFYDALVLKYAKDSLYVDFGFALNNSQANLTGNTYAFANSKFKSFNYGYLKKYFDNGFSMSFTGIASGYQKENTDTTYFKQTIGTKLDYNKNKFTTIAEAYYQTGKHKDSRDVNAYFLGLRLGYKPVKGMNVIAGVDYLSGHDALNTNADYQNTMHVFDILEGARFLFYGNANYFRNIEKHTKGGGLTDFHGTLAYKFNKKLSGKLMYHNFSLNQAVLNTNNERLTDYLATEIDVTAKYQFKKGLNLILGYSLILPTEGLETIQNVPANTSENGHYLWIMLNTKLQSNK